jgi:hypothetical protein
MEMLVACRGGVAVFTNWRGHHLAVHHPLVPSLLWAELEPIQVFYHHESGTLPSDRILLIHLSKESVLSTSSHVDAFNIKHVLGKKDNPLWNIRCRLFLILGNTLAHNLPIIHSPVFSSTFIFYFALSMELMQCPLCLIFLFISKLALLHDSPAPPLMESPNGPK